MDFAFSVLFHRSTCLFLCQYHTVLITVALHHNISSAVVMLPALLLLPPIAFAIPGFFQFHKNFRIVFSSFVRSDVVSLIGIVKFVYQSVAIYVGSDYTISDVLFDFLFQCGVIFIVVVFHIISYVNFSVSSLLVYRNAIPTAIAQCNTTMFPCLFYILLHC